MRFRACRSTARFCACSVLGMSSSCTVGVTWHRSRSGCTRRARALSSAPPPRGLGEHSGVEEELTDTDPEVRARALESLVGRKGKAAFELVLTALEDPDDLVRSRALNTAVDSNLDIPPETLIRLVQSDPSPPVRFSALTAISSYADAPPTDLDIMEIAIYGSGDSDPEVRALALNIIDRLDANEPLGDPAMPIMPPTLGGVPPGWR